METQDVSLLMNGLRKSGIYVQWNFTQPPKNEILLFAGKWMELEKIILNEVSQVQNTKGILSYVEYRPNTIQEIL
jgi:hypothetical protein